MLKPNSKIFLFL